VCGLGLRSRAGHRGPEIEEESAPVDPDVAASEEESAPVDPDVAASEEPADDADDDLAADAEAAESPEPVPTLGTALDPAPIGFEALSSAAEHGVARPVRLTIESIDVAAAPVIPVGIDAADESMEIPPADEVGWYRFGAKPGADGSAVLAAHIAYDGRDGVFRRLAELDEGSVVVIEFDDGSSQRWLVEQVTDYDKTELPDELFAVDGDPTLALITCGGLFNPSLRSYESNTVAVARPL